MSKDRAAPFSRKHRRYWIPVTGGMILIGAINVALGVLSYEAPPARSEKIELILPTATPRDAATPPDAGVDAPAAAAPPTDSSPS